jgi:hypothetical protein
MAGENVRNPVRIKHPKFADREPSVVPAKSLPHWRKRGWELVDEGKSAASASGKKEA